MAENLMTDIENLGLTIRPTALERAMGRRMRSPEGHGEGEGEGEGEGSGGKEGEGSGGGGEGEGGGAKEGEGEGSGGGGEGEGETLLGIKVKEGEGEGEGKKKVEEKKPNALLGAPEGDYDLVAAQLPEGTKIDEAAMAILSPVAREIGLSNEGVTKLAGAYAAILPNVVKQISDGIEADAAAQTKAWADETKLAVEGGKDAKPLADAKGEPVYAGKTMKEVRAIAAKALDNLGTPELRQFLETSGLGNNEALVRFAFKAGMAIREDSFERGEGAGAKPATLQSALYGTKE